MNSKKRVLFIGAGASFGARIGKEVVPPLGPALLNWLRKQCPKLCSQNGLIDLRATIESAQSLFSKFPDETNYEHLIPNLERDDRIVLQKLLQISFSDLTEKRCDLDLGFKNQIDGYDRLIEHLKINDTSWSIVSLNYDILIEEALRRKGIEFFYPHFPFTWNGAQSELPGVKVFKPHGSINFFAHGDHQIFHGEPPPDEERGLPTNYTFDKDGNPTPNHPIWFAGMPGAENVIGRAHMWEVSQPVMANYTLGKQSDTNQETLESVRMDALASCLGAEELAIIGVKPLFDPIDDQFTAKLLTMPIPNITYVAGNETECDLFQTVHPQARTYPYGLKQFLSLPR